MIKGPLVYSAFGLACILIALSFLIVILPDQIETLGMVAGVVAVLVVVVLVAILIKTRRGGVERRVLRREGGPRREGVPRQGGYARAGPH